MGAIGRLGSYLVEKPKPLIGAETIQFLLLREILDYTVLRTEAVSYTHLTLPTNREV